MAAQTVRVTVQVVGLREALNALQRGGKELTAAARTASLDIATDEAARIRGAARTRQQKLAAQSVKPRRDRVPTIVAGGNGWVRSSTGKVRGGDVFFGAEFGGDARPTTQQFPPHRGREGYFFFPTFWGDVDRMFERWEQALEVLVREWNDGPG